MTIEQEIKAIKERNARVELDKKWETSWTRKLLICILTFLVILIYNLTIRSSDNIFLNSAVPAVAFFLSTQSLSLFRKLWERKEIK